MLTSASSYELMWRWDGGWAGLYPSIKAHRRSQGSIGSRLDWTASNSHRKELTLFLFSARSRMRKKPSRISTSGTSSEGAKWAI